MRRSAAAVLGPVALLSLLLPGLAGCSASGPSTTLPTYTGGAAASAAGPSSTGPTSAPSTSAGADGATPSGSVSALPSQVLASMASVRPGDPSPLFNRLPAVTLVPGAQPWKTLPALPSGPHKGLPQGVVIASAVPPQSADEKAILDAMTRYLQYVMKAQYDVKVDAKALAQVAAADKPAGTRLVKYVAYLKAKKARTVGWMSIRVTQLLQEIGAKTPLGMITMCLDNGSFDALAAGGKPIETVVPSWDATMVVERLPQGWRVTSWDTTQREGSCPVPAA